MSNSGVLADTSLWVPFFRSRPPTALQERFRKEIGSGTMLMHPVVRLEILAGCRDEADYARVSSQLEGLDVVPVSDSTWRLADRRSFEMKRMGLTVRLPDMLIAVAAVEHDVTLIHADSDFEALAPHLGMRTEDLSSIL